MPRAVTTQQTFGIQYRLSVIRARSIACLLGNFNIFLRQVHNQHDLSVAVTTAHMPQSIHRIMQLCDVQCCIRCQLCGCAHHHCNVTGIRALCLWPPPNLFCCTPQLQMTATKPDLIIFPVARSNTCPMHSELTIHHYFTSNIHALSCIYVISEGMCLAYVCIMIVWLNYVIC